MHRLARTSLLALALALPACSESSGPETLTVFDCDRAVRYSIGQTVTGSITTSDCTVPEGDGLVDFYQFSLASSGPVSIVVNRPGGSGTMYAVLVGAGEELIDIAEFGPGQEVALGGQLDAGTYVIVVGGQVPGQSSYTLSSSATLPPSGPPFFDCTVAELLSLGATESGTLGTGDCVTADGSWMDRYQFSLTSARTVTIDLMSDTFDTYLYLFNSEGTVLRENDDFGSGFNSRISLSLPAGTYSIGATSYSPGSAGSYTVTAQ